MEPKRNARETTNIGRCRALLRCAREIKALVTAIMTDYAVVPSQPQADDKPLPSLDTVTSVIEQATSIEAVSRRLQSLSV